MYYSRESIKRYLTRCIKNIVRHIQIQKSKTFRHGIDHFSFLSFFDYKIVEWQCNDRENIFLTFLNTIVLNENIEWL